MSKKYDKLLKEYRKLAKRADERLVRLEMLSQEKGYGPVLKYGYANAKADAERWGSKGKLPRFNIKPPKSANALKAKIKDIEKFLSYETSTKAGIKRTYQKRVNKLNKEYGMDFTWDEFADFFESSLYERMTQLEYYADMIFETVGRLQANKDEVLKALTSAKKGEKVHLKIMDKDGKADPILEDTVNKLINDYGRDIKDFFTS